MFYHESLLFDYKGFLEEAKPLVAEVEQGNLSSTYVRAEQIAASIEPESFVLANYGQWFRLPESESSKNFLRFQSSNIGYWFLLIMSKYLQPNPNSIGLHWSYLKNNLPKSGWSENDVVLLFEGLPIGSLLLGKDIERRKAITHEDPFWYWIRPHYTYNQGGWLSLTECKRLYEQLQNTKLSKNPPDENLSGSYKRALAMLSTAIDNNLGLYMVELWDWDDEDEEAEKTEN